ncbi:MAG: decaprenyl-phosphate phosphoribosyltransferase [Acidimicrobiales bacterium]|nr:decaprenyl-phosphate phosphoribosyltransferase [Acidimicrobiales bacterium]
MTNQDVDLIGEPGPVPGPVRQRSLPAAIIAGARPKQWVKNLLVFAAPGAAGVLDGGEALLQATGAFGCFCLASGGTYFLNDAADVEADRLHPTKRFRPVASGDVSVGAARAIGTVAIVGAVALGWMIDWHLAVVLGAYVVLTTCYSTWLKHIAVVDVVAVAAGFVLRAIAGGTATDVPISNWFFIVTSFGSLFMVVAKRRAEVEALGDDAAATRKALGTYSLDFIIHLQTIATSVVLVGYCLWAFEKAELATTGVPWFQLSIVPFALAVLRYSLLVDSGQGGAPEDVVMGDRTLQLFGICWAVLFALGVYLL